MSPKRPERAFDPDHFAIRTPATVENRGTYDDRLNRILTAATLVIARDGYEKASMRAIASAAGVSLAGLYHYLDSKDHLLFLIQSRAFNSLLATLRERLLGVDDPIDQLRVMVRSHVSYFAANMAALKVCSHELDSLSGPAYEQLRQTRHDYYGLVRSMVDRIIESSNEHSRLDAHVATMSLFGMLNWLYRWYDPTAGLSPTRLANQITAQFLGGLLSASEQSTNDRHRSDAGRKAAPARSAKS